MPCKADVIVMEIFDSELIGEGVLGTMQHALAVRSTDNPAAFLNSHRQTLTDTHTHALTRSRMLPCAVASRCRSTSQLQT